MKDKAIVFLVLLILAEEICFNLNIITGISLQFEHFYYVIGSMLIYILAGYILYKFLSKAKLQTYITLSWTLVVLLIVCIVQISKASIFNLKAKQCNPKITQIIKYLNKLPKNSVVYAYEGEIQELILNYTPQFSFINENNVFNITYHEVINRLAILYKFKGIDLNVLNNHDDLMIKNQVLEFLYNIFLYFKFNRLHPPPSIFSSLQSIDYRSYDKNEYIYAFPQEVVNDLVNAYSNTDLNHLPYKLDFLIVKRNHNINTLNNQSLFELIYYNDSYAIYKYKKS